MANNFQKPNERKTAAKTTPKTWMTVILGHKT